MTNIFKRLLLVLALILIFPEGANADQKTVEANHEKTPPPHALPADAQKLVTANSYFVPTIKKLITAMREKDLESALSLMADPLQSQSDGVDIETYVSDQMMPFFADYFESTNVNHLVYIRGKDDINGYAAYEQFISRSGKKKSFMVKIMGKDTQVKIVDLSLDRKYSDDYPEYARLWEKKHRQVEMIRPTAEPGHFWTAPGTK